MRSPHSGLSGHGKGKTLGQREPPQNERAPLLRQGCWTGWVLPKALPSPGLTPRFRNPRLSSPSLTGSPTGASRTPAVGILFFDYKKNHQQRGVHTQQALGREKTRRAAGRGRRAVPGAPQAAPCPRGAPPRAARSPVHGAPPQAPSRRLRVGRPSPAPLLGAGAPPVLSRALPGAPALPPLRGLSRAPGVFPGLRGLPPGSRGARAPGVFHELPGVFPGSRESFPELPGSFPGSPGFPRRRPSGAPHPKRPPAGGSPRAATWISWMRLKPSFPKNSTRLASVRGPGSSGEAPGPLCPAAAGQPWPPRSLSSAPRPRRSPGRPAGAAQRPSRPEARPRGRRAPTGFQDPLQRKPLRSRALVLFERFCSRRLLFEVTLCSVLTCSAALLQVYRGPGISLHRKKTFIERSLP